MNDKYDQAAAIGYEIIIEGHLSDTWADWFNGLNFEYTGDGNTILTGTVIDQSALHGLLKKVRDLGLTLLSVNRVQPSTGEPALNTDPEMRVILLEEPDNTGEGEISNAEASLDADPPDDQKPLEDL
jgi:hypothetical protein